jgi:hypothetical protein
MTLWRLSGALLIVLLLGGCSEPETPASISSTTTDDGDDLGTATTTSAPIPTTTSSASTSTTEAPGTTLSTQDPPVIELLLPGANEIIPESEIDDYYIFARAVGVTSVTTLFESKTSAPGRAEAWSIELRVDGTKEHWIFETDSAQSESGEMITIEDRVWSRSEDEEWQVGETSDLEGEEFMFKFFASPDVAYLWAWAGFDELEFVGWQEVGTSSHALYRGNVEDGMDRLSGPMEVLWSPDGYFSFVAMEFVNGGEAVSFRWTVSEVGTTVVEAPN